MSDRKKLEKLVSELRQMEEEHKSMWMTYGSELCAGDMINKENSLQKQIDELQIKIANEETRDKRKKGIVK